MVLDDFDAWVRKGRPAAWQGNGHGKPPARASPERVNAQGLTYNEFQAEIIRGTILTAVSGIRGDTT